MIIKEVQSNVCFFLLLGVGHDGDVGGIGVGNVANVVAVFSADVTKTHSSRNGEKFLSPAQPIIGGETPDGEIASRCRETGKTDREKIN